MMMRMLKYLLEKEFKQIRRDRFLPRIIFLLPVIQLVVLPFAANFEMRNINLSIVDNDHTVLSRRLTDKVLSSGYFRLAVPEGDVHKGGFLLAFAVVTRIVAVDGEADVRDGGAFGGVAKLGIGGQVAH